MTEPSTVEKKIHIFRRVLPLLPQRTQPPNLTPPAFCGHQHCFGIAGFRHPHPPAYADFVWCAARLRLRLGRPLFL